MKRVLAACALAFAACATNTAGSATAPAAAPTAPVKSDLPDFALNSVDGDQVRLSDYVGKGVVVLSFWATWCEPCKTELPQLAQIYDRHKAEGLNVLAIAMDDPTTVAQVAPYVKRSAFSFPVLLDAETKAAGLYNPHKSAPYLVVIGRDGRIAAEKAGYEPGAEKDLEATVVKLLAANP